MKKWSSRVVIDVAGQISEMGTMTQKKMMITRPNETKYFLIVELYRLIGKRYTYCWKEIYILLDTKFILSTSEL